MTIDMLKTRLLSCTAVASGLRRDWLAVPREAMSPSTAMRGGLCPDSGGCRVNLPLMLLFAGLAAANVSVADTGGSTGAETRIPAAIALPTTDGAEASGAAGRPGAIERLRRLRAAQRACEGPCVTPFGSRLGAADGVEARSNCVSTCLRLQYSFVDPQTGDVQVAKTSPDPERFEYAGVTYQCVEYARRWWIRSRAMTFGDVPTAADIFDLEEAIALPGRASIPLGRSLNGAAKRPPQRGDLVIYSKDPDDPEWRFGHVAVVVDIDLGEGWVALAEENYDNRRWRDPESYARRIRVFSVGGRYTLIDVEPGRTQSPDGGHIVGWVYPAAER